MPIFNVQDPNTGKTLSLFGESAPTEVELEQLFAQQASQPTQPQFNPLAEPTPVPGQAVPSIIPEGTPTTSFREGIAVPAATGVISGLLETAEGIKDLTNFITPDALDLPNVFPETRQGLQEFQQSFPQGSRQLSQATEFGTEIGVLAPLKVPSVISKMNGIKGGLAKLANGMAQGVFVGGIQEAKDDDERIINMLIGLGFGSSLPVLEGLIRFGVNFRTPLVKAIQGVSKKVSQKAIEATERLGVRRGLTPGESTADDILLAEEGRLVLMNQARQKLKEFTQGREREVLAIVKKSIRKILPEGKLTASRRADELYSISREQVLPSTVVQKFLTDPIIGKIFDQVKKDVFRKTELSGLGDDTIGVWDAVKRELQNATQTEIAAVGTGLQRASKEVASKLAQKSSEVREALVGASKEYGLATGIAGRIIQHNKILGELDKIRGASEGFTSVELYKKVLLQDSTRKDLIRSLKDIPGSKQMITDLTTFLGAIAKSTVKKSVTGGAITLRERAGATEFINFNLLQLARGGFDNAFVEVITNPQRWKKAFDQVKKITERDQRLEAFSNLLQKVSIVTKTDEEEFL